MFEFVGVQLNAAARIRPRPTPTSRQLTPQQTWLPDACVSGEPATVTACRVFAMGLIRTMREWWQAWVAALGGANQMTMREAYRDDSPPLAG